MEENVDIFILGYKAFLPKVKHNVYTIVDGGEEDFETNLTKLCDNTLDNISSLNGFYSELTRIYWIWKNMKLKKYVGFCHYRRYFSFYDDIPNLDDIFQAYDIILPNPTKLSNNIKKRYSNCHNVKDLDLVISIINELYPEYSDIINAAMEQKFIFPCNIFIMKKDMFIEYCEFIFGIIEEFRRRRNFHSMDDVCSYVNEHSSEYIKKCYPTNEVWYQSRIGGFLAERLLNIFVLKKCKNIKCFKINVTEKKYSK